MKSFTYTKLQTFCIAMFVLTASLLPFPSSAQDGQNDATFNKPDRVPAQGANNEVQVSAVQSDNKIIIAGTFSSYNGTESNKLARLKQDGTLDKSFDAGQGANGTIYTITILPNNKILITGNFKSFNGITANGIVRLNSNGCVDPTFSAAIEPNSGIYETLVQPDGKILIAGGYEKLRRLNANGSIDPSFSVVFDTLLDIQQVALQADGKILLAGTLNLNGFRLSVGIVRVNQNGSKDFTFRRYVSDYGDNRQYLNALTVESSGDILLVNDIYSEGRAYYGKLIHLGPSGDFINEKYIFWINSLLLQPDGKIVLTGFKHIENNLFWYTLKRSIVRLNPDLTIDSSLTFDDKKIYSKPVDATIQSSALQLDGKILIGGHFFETSGLISNNLARLNPNGSFDVTFNQRKGVNGTVLASAVQGDGKTIIGGGFSRYNYQFVSNLVRLKKNGEQDASFNTGSGPNGRVYTVTIQPTGKILIGGSFTSFNGHNCSNIARLNKDGSFDESFEGTTDNTVRKIIIDRNGKILIAGDFRNVNGIQKHVLTRLLSNGKLDDIFNSSILINQWDETTGAYDLAISSRGQIYTTLQYLSHVYEPYGTNLIRLGRNGAIDSSFKIPQQLFYEIQAVTLNNDGKPVASGSAVSGAGIVAQFNTDGSIDTSFHYQQLKNLLNGKVRTLTVLENDKLIIGGDFSSTLNHIGLLNKDGSIDHTFVGSADNSIYTATRTNDKLIIGGTFNEYAGAVRNSIARINIEVPAFGRLQSAIGKDETGTDVLNVYPNPAASNIHIDHLKPGSSFEIFNALGRKMYSATAGNESITLELSDYSNGVYFIVITNDERTIKKFIVNK